MKVDAYLARLAEFSGADVLFSGERRFTYADLLARLDGHEATLRRAGVQRRQLVQLIGDFSVDSLAVLLALARIGAVVAPFTGTSWRSLGPLAARLEPHWTLRLAEDGLQLEPLRPAGPAASSEQLARAAPGVLVFTSGSSGAPKGILHALEPLLAKFETRRAAHRAIPFLLFDHMGGLNTALSLLSSGGSIVQLPTRAVTPVCEAIARLRVTLLPTTPTFLNLLLGSGEHKNHDLSSLRVITYGTEPMAQPVLERLVATFPGVTFKQTYGMSELGVLVTSSRANDSTWLRLGGDGIETDVRDGILWIKAPSRLQGHFTFDGAGPPTWHVQQDAWLCTHDLVDQDGPYLRFRGRDSELINVGGLKVHPLEVESCLLECPQVKDASVTGEKHLLTGMIVTAEVVLAPDADRAGARDLLERHCRARLERFKVPAKLRFVDALSMSERGKKVRGRGAAVS